MSKTITRTFTTYKVKVKNALNEEVIKEYPTEDKITKEKATIKYIKENGAAIPVIIEIEEVEIKREISVEDFLKYSKVVEPKKDENTNSESATDSTEGEGK